MKLGLSLRCQNHDSQVSHSLIRFRKLASEKMKLRKHTREKEKKKDTLSDFPDCILLHILSFLNTKEVVQTCILSTRWKDLWKRLPTLTLSLNHFTTVEGFTEFVKQTLSLWDASMAINTLDFKHYSRTDVESDLVERIVTYVVSHNVNHVRIACYPPHITPDLIERVETYAVSHNVNPVRLSCCLHHIPPLLFSCPSLTSLDIELPNYLRARFPNSLNLPALTRLKLRHFIFYTKNDNDDCVEPFTTFNRLNTLILRDCRVRGWCLCNGYQQLCKCTQLQQVVIKIDPTRIGLIL